MSRRAGFVHRSWFLPGVVFLVCWTLTTHGKYSVMGDEPHYLIVTQSLLADRDLDVRNNHEQRQGILFGSDGLVPGPHVLETRGGQLFSVHDIGVSVTLLPVYAVARRLAELPPEHVLKRFRMSPGLFAYALISLFLIGLTAVACALTHGALLDRNTSAGIATGVTLILWLSPPVLSNAFVVFPEVFALLATAGIVRFSARMQITGGALCAAALVLGLLPWFHRKYVLYAFALLLVLAWIQRKSVQQQKPPYLFLSCAAFAAPLMALAAWSWQHWGTFGGPLTAERIPFSWAALKSGSLGLLVDRENGLLVWAPVYLVLPAAWMLTWRRNGVWLAPVAALFFPAAAHDQWWGGFSPACRFLLPLVPIFALIISDGIRAAGLKRTLLLLAIPQVLISAYGWQRPRALWPRGDGVNRAISGLSGWAPGIHNLLPSVRVERDYLAALVFVAFLLVVSGLVCLWLHNQNRDVFSGCSESRH